MKEKDWIRFKKRTEKKFKSATIEKCWGFQIQKNTRWNPGMSPSEIQQFEQLLGLKFPENYVEMLKAFNGLETLQISIDPEGKKEDGLERRGYKYPEDLEKTKEKVAEVYRNLPEVYAVLREAGFETSEVEGFIPLYEHRVLVVLKNKQHSPVLSVCGSDIVLYGKSLIQYWCHEFHLKFKLK